jgi:copper(I)-binding protein
VVGTATAGPAFVAALAALPLLAGCATGFNAPTRHAIANLQAASAAVSDMVTVADAQVFVSADDKSSAGGVAYLEFTVINHLHTADSLQVANTTVTTVSDSVSPSASPQPVAATMTPIGSIDVPKGSEQAPGITRVTLALQGLKTELSVGMTVQATLDFATAGRVENLLVPVTSASSAGTFLPTAPPSPSSAGPSPSAGSPSAGPSSSAGSPSANPSASAST